MSTKVVSPEERKLSRVDHSIDIQAPHEKVFAYATNVEMQPHWVKWAKRVEVTSSQKEGLGTTDVMDLQVGPRKEHVEGLVTEYRPGMTYSRRLTKGLDLQERMSALSLGNVTKFAYSVEYKPPMGPLGKVVDFLFMSRLMDQLMKDSLFNLKENLEGR